MAKIKAAEDRSPKICIHLYWNTPRISFDELDELERQNLIERSPTFLRAIRLTDEGELVKEWPQLMAR